MQLMKWFRKNNQKLMAIVVVVLMIGFVGGTALTRSCENLGQSRNKTVAIFDRNQKIRLSDLDNAQRELSILLELKANLLLRSISIPILQTGSLQGLALGEILFSERQSSPLIVSHLKQVKMQGFSVTDKQIYDIYKRSEPSYVYWLLLTKEAEQAGIIFSKEQARLDLSSFLPQLFQSAAGSPTYAQVINAIINAPSSEGMHVSEDQILSAFCKLKAVIEYCRVICSTEDVTEQQIMHYVSDDLQTVDVNFVRFDSDVFTKDIPEPNAGQLNEQFEKYKDCFAGQFSQENPYGFGYKIPDCIQLQYIAIRLNDVEKVVPKPTQEEIEQFYSKNKANFITKIPSDPNDPNSLPIEQTRPFAEVADPIEQALLRQKIDKKANQIIQRALILTESPQADSNQLSQEQFVKIANNYTAAARELKKEFNIEIIVGQTGLLSALDIQRDEILGKFILEGPQFDPVRNPTFEWLYKIVFAVDQIGASEIDPFNITKPQMYKNIGPLNDLTGEIKAVVRIIKAQKASPPESINQSFDKETITADPCSREIKIYSVKDDVVKDLKKIAAMDLTRQKAEEFKQEVEQTDNWQQAIDKLNKEYPKAPDKKSTDTNNFQLGSLRNQQQISESKIQTWELNAAGNPAWESDLRSVLKQRIFIDQLDALARADANGPKTPFVWEFNSDLSYYCIKDLSCRHVYQNDYDSEKVRQMFLEDTVRSQSLALVYFNPDNILKRTKFQWLQERKTTRAGDANQPKT